MRCECNDKHKQPWQRGHRASLCPRDMKRTAENLLQDGEAVDGKRYAVHEGRARCAQKHGDDIRHGYPIGWSETPKSLRHAWVGQGRLRRQYVRKHWNG